MLARVLYSTVHEKLLTISDVPQCDYVQSLLLSAVSSWLWNCTSNLCNRLSRPQNSSLQTVLISRQTTQDVDTWNRTKWSSRRPRRASMLLTVSTDTAQLQRPTAKRLPCDSMLCVLYLLATRAFLWEPCGPRPHDTTPPDLSSQILDKWITYSWPSRHRPRTVERASRAGPTHEPKELSNPSSTASSFKSATKSFVYREVVVDVHGVEYTKKYLKKCAQNQKNWGTDCQFRKILVADTDETKT